MSEPTYIQVPLTHETAEVILGALINFQSQGFEVEPYLTQVSDYIVDMKVEALNAEIAMLQQGKSGS